MRSVEDLDLKYYRKEMEILQEEGKAFAEQYPEIAHFLNMDDIKNPDPTVERILEGVAFLNSKIKQQIDSDYPEISESLLALISPQYLLGYPHHAIVEMNVDQGLIKNNTYLPSKTLIRTEADGIVDHSSCLTYSTMGNLKLDIIELKIQSDNEIGNQNYLDLALLTPKGFENINISVDNIRIYIENSDNDVAYLLRYYLLYYLSKVEVINDGIQHTTPAAFKKVDLDYVDSYEDRGEYNEGYHKLLEFFNFKEGSLFVDLINLDKNLLISKSGKVVLRLYFSKNFPQNTSIPKDIFRLNCVPIVNLFPIDIKPIQILNTHTEYWLLPESNFDNSIYVYDVKNVLSSKNIKYMNFVFRSFTPKNSVTRSYYVKRISNKKVGSKICISCAPTDYEEDIISIEGLGSNINEHHKATLNNKKLNRTINSPYIKDLKLVSTRTYEHFLQEKNRWLFVELFKRHMIDLFSLEEFKLLLSLFASKNDSASEQYISSIDEMKHKMITRVRKGCVEKGWLFDLKVHSKNFKDLYLCLLFCEKLYDFLSAFVSINLFVKLNVTILENNQNYLFGDNNE